MGTINDKFINQTYNKQIKFPKLGATVRLAPCKLYNTFSKMVAQIHKLPLDSH